MTKPSILITGGAKRIGAAIALNLGTKGYPICIHYHSSKTEALHLVEKVQKAGGKARVISGDLTKTPDVKALIGNAQKALGQPIEVLINNAGAFVEDSLETMSSETFSKNFDTNLKAPLFLAQEFAQSLPKDLKGNIINITDQRVLKTSPGFLSYTLSKHALFNLTRLLALDLAPEIRVNAIAPGPTFKNIFQTEKEFEEEAAGVPLGQGPDLDDFTATIIYILSTPSLTGQMIPLDGGQHLV